MWRASSACRTSLGLTRTRPFTTTCSTLQPRISPHPPDLIKWVRTQGGFVHQSVKVSHVGTQGLGVVATDDIPQGSDLIALPPHLPLGFGRSCSPPVLGSLAQRVPEELWAMKLGLKLLHARAKTGSFWWPYISNLPETYSVPIFFQGEDIKNLQYAPLLHQVNKRCRFLLDFEMEIKNALANINPGDHPFENQDIDASSLGWALSAVSSRAFRLRGDKLSDGTHKDMPMMLPLIDMCNHSFSPNAKIIQDQDAEKSNVLVKVVAETSIKRDDPLELNYGCLSNDLFLLDYGFVMTANPYDCVELRYDAVLLDAASMAAGVRPCFSSPASWQRDILSRLNLDGAAPDLKVTLGGPELVEGRFLAGLRVLHASDAETVHKHELSTLHSLSAEAPLGISNEVATLRTIIALCAIVLQHFPTKIMDDESLLKQGVSSSSELAINFRIQKKSLVVNLMVDLTKRVKLLQSKESNAAA